MSYHIINNKNEIVGWSADEFDPGGDLRLVPEGEPIEPLSLDALKAERVEVIKTEARERIEALAWRIERAKERDLIGAEGETIAEVYAEREAIRQASARAEADLMTLTEAEKISAFTWDVLEQDYIKPSKITKLAFVRRFSDEEYHALAQARSQNPQLAGWWEKLNFALNINLADQETITGIYFLEKMGLIGKGRAAQILAIDSSG
ncbi:hypothetical protein [Rappaport israeli]|uniref:hypothetical protein n=1 Tax=Rappaport israeli TaxID=1839807 RepID=UPI0009307D7D|nr:hypothetical protein [Rappaport israeli]